MRLTDWKKHARTVKSSNGSRPPKTYSSMKNVVNNNIGKNMYLSSTTSTNFINSNKNAQILMLLERTQKENDQLKEEVIHLTKKHAKVKEESDFLLEIMADERNENKRLEKELLQMEQFSADTKMKKELEEKIEELISTNRCLQDENKNLKEMKVISDEQLQFYQNALVNLKATTSKSVSPISTHRSTTHLSQRLLNLKSEFTKSQLKYKKETEEYHERIQRLCDERDTLKKQLQTLSNKNNNNNNNNTEKDHQLLTDANNKILFLETKLKLAEKKKMIEPNSSSTDTTEYNIVENMPKENKLEIETNTNVNNKSQQNVFDTALALEHIFLNFINASKHQIHSISEKHSAIDALLTYLKSEAETNLDGVNQNVKDIFFSPKSTNNRTFVNISNVFFSINRYIKTGVRSCKSCIVVNDCNNATGNEIFQFSDQGPSTLLTDAIICFHLFAGLESVAENIPKESIVEFISSIALSRLFLDGLIGNLTVSNHDNSGTDKNAFSEWKWYLIMREALTEIGTKCIKLLPSNDDIIQTIFAVLLLPQKSSKTHVPGSPRRKTLIEGVDDGTNVPRFLSDVMNTLILEYGPGGIGNYFKNVDVGSFLTLYSKVMQSKSLGSEVAAEEILYLAVLSSAKSFLSFTQHILNDMDNEEKSQVVTNGVELESRKTDHEILLHVRDVSLTCLNEHMSARKIQQMVKKES
jgi:hypothetical protein